MMVKFSGFTLFEVVLVLAIGISITAIGIVSLSRLQKMFQLRSSADEIRSQIQYGRELAIANKNNSVYSISLSGTVVSLKAGGKEITRYQFPQGITATPPSFNFIFSANTGTIGTCSSCQLTLFATGATEIINIQSNGIVN